MAPNQLKFSKVTAVKLSLDVEVDALAKMNSAILLSKADFTKSAVVQLILKKRIKIFDHKFSNNFTPAFDFIVYYHEIMTADLILRSIRSESVVSLVHSK